MDLEHQIRELASSGVNRAEAARRLGFTVPQMEKVCSVMADLRWGSRRRTTPDHLEKLKLNLSKARDVRLDKSRRTVRGITGTVDELCAHFDVSATPRTVRQRMSEGMNLEEALFAGQRTSRIRDWSNVVFSTTGRTFVHQRQ
jgi:hypothetical protein